MDHHPSRQAGMTLIGFLLMFVLIGFFTLLVLKLGPIYLNHYKVVTSLESIRKEASVSEKSKEEILTLLEKRWDINSVDHVSAKDVKITKQDGRVKVQIAYEVVEHIMGNVDALITFDNAVETGPN